MTPDDILSISHSPADLERLYRSDPDQFAAVLPGAWARGPDSVILSVWRERLAADATPAIEGSSDRYLLAVTAILALAAGTLVKLPAYAGLAADWYYPRFPVPLTVASLVIYFLARRQVLDRLALAVSLAILCCFALVTLLPDRPGSDSVILSLIHIPLVLWTCLGVAFCGAEWRSVDRRTDYLRYWGEIIPYAALILLGGMVLTGLTLALFRLINVDINKWYMSYVVVYGVVASPVVATYLHDTRKGKVAKLAPMLANVFAPLFLLTVVAYLIVMAATQRSPYSDRDFLISLNGLLLVVLAITIFSVAERSSATRRTFADATNISLVAVTLVIDAIALSAIVFRLSSMGITPNRLAVLGANLLIFVHLARLIGCYISVIRRRLGKEQMDALTARYVPWYSIWTAFVAFGFPVLFRFE